MERKDFLLNDNETQDLKEDLGNLKSNLNESKTLLFQAVNDVKSLAQSALNQSLQTIKNTTHQGQENVAAFTQKYPIRMIGIAMVTGVIAGKFLKL